MGGNPFVFELNARLFLRRLSARTGTQVTLGSIPDEVWERLAGLGFNYVWPMGVWQRSAGARREALAHPGLRQEYGRALPDWTEADVEGSPYAVRSYTVDTHLGAAGDLRLLRDQLHRLGLGLILDFVPNHVALDHPWTTEAPGRLVPVRAEQAAEHPDWFYRSPKGTLLAHGRDPYFGPWTDTAQVDFFSDDLRRSLTEQLLAIAEVADGVRCDMAMLGLNEVFEWLWGAYAHNSRPQEEFWERAIPTVKELHPHFFFIAEAYWGHEAELLHLGFDYTYDKTLYDRLRDEGAESVLAHIEGQVERDRWVRFVENHDEARAAAAFGKERGMAASSIIATLPGLRLFHDGQMEGRTVRLPIQLVREPEGEPDLALAEDYERLLRAAAADVFHSGGWSLLEPRPAGWVDGTHRNVLAWQWRSEGEVRVCAVNYSGADASAYVAIPGGPARWYDQLDGTQGVAEAGGAVRLSFGPWQARILMPG